MNQKISPVMLLLLTAMLAGCTAPEPTHGALAANPAFQIPGDFAGPADSIQWPDFTGVTLRILDHGAFYGCADLGAKFQELTGAAVTCTSADDTGSALNRAVAGAGNPEFDVLYGADNLLMRQAESKGVFQAYTPQLAHLVATELQFLNGKAWLATPVDHGYIALNIDDNHEALAGVEITNLWDVRDNADLFVTQDPRTSTPGLGFFLSTVAVLGSDPEIGWQRYWSDLFDGGVLVTSGWSEAYETHFSGGYGVWTEGHIGDRPIVTSYTESPAYEAFYGATDVASVLLTHESDAPVMHQIQTMAILAGTPNEAVAQAWIEFALTDDFQTVAAPVHAVYPVVTSDAVLASVDDTYGTDAAIHPAPGTFEVADFDYTRDGESVANWVEAWVSLCEAHSCI